MKKILILIGFSIVFFACKSNELTTQIAPENEFFALKKDALFFFRSNQLDWGAYEEPVDTATRAKYVAQLDTSFWYIIDYGFEGFYTKEEYYNSFHFLHLNDDNELDLIYEGWGGGEGTVVKAFINEGEQMKFLFDNYQQLYDLQFDEKRCLKSFKVLDFGCCVPFDLLMSQYTIKNNTIELEWGLSALSGLEEPKHFFRKAKKVKVAKPKVDMRYEPWIAPEDEPGYSGPLEVVGNKTALYNKGDKGVAYAETKDTIGNVWWLVEMEVPDTTDFNIMYKYSQKTYPVLGWINKNDLK
ncbi:MAG: hypothetical protein GY810_02895 [Aureispira sp.]|nr:hypothetical protein [Aureispira sp.]